MASSSSFRPLRPSSSSANPSETQPEDPASPSPVSSHAGVPQQDSLNAAKARKRRAPSHVSQNACTNCKRARAKCDGEDPEPCSRCIQRDIGDQCHYEVHVKTAKEEMVRRIKALEQQVGELQSSMRAKDNWIARALDSMEGNSMDPNHARVGRENRLDGQLTHLLGRPSGGSHYDASPGTEKAFSDIIQKCEQSMSFNHQPGSDDGPAFTWTKLVHPRVTTHLMGLYFTWIHPVHMLFSERHFMSSFESGNSEHCSKALVNVICAMGCFMLMDHGRDDTDARQLSEYFLHQFRADITMENQSRLTFATAYAILFLVELSANQARRAASHLRVAVDALQMVDRTIYPNDAFEIAAWGVYTLETM
ncbi:hypothetical protein BDY21DRAFT_79942 [Lineolata rhizophorae]|uniref:Zn(2)-C6 fungal-type domain-containing protein n=1 Tax=Lineolata rhizophorae TaxID=578093 RepID=A0A6A6NV56_9PEZI|nr:hypothetical protein BDY21DRAFT_79942 [Lineolata rhizophorae]